MENLVVVLFIIPGFLFQNSVRSIQNIKESGNWSYLIPLALWSSIFILFAKLFNLLIKRQQALLNELIDDYYSKKNEDETMEYLKCDDCKLEKKGCGKYTLPL